MLCTCLFVERIAERENRIGNDVLFILVVTVVGINRFEDFKFVVMGKARSHECLGQPWSGQRSLFEDGSHTRLLPIALKLGTSLLESCLMRLCWPLAIPSCFLTLPAQCLPFGTIL